MPFGVRPARDFDDVAAPLGPKNPASSVCWCLSHRLDARTNRSLVGPERREVVRELVGRDTAPGVLADDVGAAGGGGDLAVGWGIAHHLVEGAARYAFERGAPAVEGYPVDNGGARVDLTMAFVGTRAIFEGAGFAVASPTESKAGGYPRVLVRRYP